LKHESGAAVDEVLEEAGPASAVKRWDVPPDEPILAAEQHELIDRAIGELPDMYRDVFVLADVQGLDNAEIGELLNLSVPAVKSRLHRARMRMRELLAPHFEAEDAP
jgi:RNA polymerase sigma-70 factor, ECF subfamily